MENQNTKLKYSKSSAFYLKTKQDFFTQNDKLLADSLKQNRLYTSQPARVACKLCEAPLPRNGDFRSHGVEYVFCDRCSHLNGRFEDTQTFVEKLYIAEDGSDYSNDYIDKEFLKRTIDIYVPKVDFLVSSLPVGRQEILDVGCGCGYFVFASLLRNLKATGFDVSKTMVEFGNKEMARELNTKPLYLVSEQDFFEAIVKTKANVVSAIGVIEHLREPLRFFDAFRKSEAKYLYYSVPMFSFSVILENLFSNVFPRQLAGGHTHLFTESSIRKMHEILGVRSVAEWRFGTDVMDLYRHATTTLQKNAASPKMMEQLQSGLGTIVDELQAVFDRNHTCSEIHCVVSKG